LAGGLAAAAVSAAKLDQAIKGCAWAIPAKRLCVPLRALRQSGALLRAGWGTATALQAGAWQASHARAAAKPAAGLLLEAAPLMTVVCYFLFPSLLVGTSGRHAVAPVGTPSWLMPTRSSSTCRQAKWFACLDNIELRSTGGHHWAALLNPCRKSVVGLLMCWPTVPIARGGRMVPALAPNGVSCVLSA